VISASCSAERALTEMSRMIQSCVTLTMSIAPMSPPTRPMAVATSPSVPDRLDNLTRKVRL
jgi:hypothetical protein